MKYKVGIILFILLPLVLLMLLYSKSLKENGRIFLSIDRGESWQRADNGFPQDATVNDFAYANGLYFAGTDANGVFISQDNLKSWYKSNDGLPADVKIDAVETLKSEIILGTNKNGIFISEDEGKNWHVSNNGLTNLTVRCLYLFGLKIFVGTGDGIFVSDDRGKSWKHIYSGKQINGITSLNDKIYAGHNMGTAISIDSGKTWNSIYDHSGFHNISNDGVHLFGMLYEPAVLKSLDGGLHWTKSDFGLPNLYTFQITNVGNRLLAAQWDGIYKSDNKGDRWVKSSEGLPVDQPFKELLVVDFTIVAGAGMIPK